MTYPPSPPPTGPQQQPNFGQPRPGYPQAPQYGQPHPGQYPPRPPKKTPVWPWILIGGAVLLCGGCFGIVGLASNADSDKNGKASTSAVAAPIAADAPSPAPKAPAAPKIAPAGSAVRDGKFEFQVTEIDAPVKTIGTNQFLRSTAQGEYIVIHVTISNVGNEPRSYFGSNQKLYDDQGREFTNDSRAEINVNDHMSAEINPGNQVAMQLVFDVPAGTNPATLELHDSMFSGGVKVALH